MGTKSMNCLFCVLKHIAGALSYGKEILNGHGIEKDLDHRIDFLGEIINAEHHLELFNAKQAQRVRLYREDLQFRSLRLIEGDLAFLRELYKRIEKGNQEQSEIPIKETEKLSSPPAILFLEIKNQQFFNLCFTMIKRCMSNYSAVYCLSSDIDLASYPEITKINYEDIKEEYILVYPDEKSILLKKMDCMDKLPLSDQGVFPFHGSKISLKSYIDNRDYQRYIRENKIKIEGISNGFILNRKLCCSNRYNAQIKTFCYIENQEAYYSLKEYLKVD